MLGLFGTQAVKKTRKSKTFKTYKYTFYGRELVVQGYERQALEYLVEKGYKPEDILTESEFGNGLNIRYKYGKKMRTYMPDIYIRGANIVVEVKSIATMGLLNNKKRGWSMNRAKAKACLAKRYRFMLLLMRSNGERIPLPVEWYNMSKPECLARMERAGIQLRKTSVAKL